MFRIIVGFVDTSYWDDGSRWIRRQFEFETRKEFLDFYNKLKKDQSIYACGQNRTQWFNIDPDDIKCYYISAKKLTDKNIAEYIEEEENEKWLGSL
jgi:hypothetical protein